MSYIYTRKMKEDAMKFRQENEPILKGCPNKTCFCTGACQEIIGWKKKPKHDFSWVNWII